MKLFVGWRLFAISVLLAMPFFGWAITRIVKNQEFDNNATYYIDGASKAKDIKSACEQINIANDYLVNNGLTSGYTSIISRTPDEDLFVFYQDIDKKMKYFCLTKDYTDESYIILYQKYVDMREMKPHDISVPPGISIYPYNLLYLIWMFVSIVMAIISIIGIVTFIDEKSD